MLSLTESHPLRNQTSNGLSISSASQRLEVMCFVPFCLSGHDVRISACLPVQCTVSAREKPIRPESGIYAQCNFFSPSGASAGWPPTLNKNMKNKFH